MSTKDLGPVTAYAYAKAHGYTGTEEEFEELMGDLAQIAEDAQDAVETVTTLSASASQLATTAQPTATYNHSANRMEFGIPKGNGIRSITNTSTVGAVKTYTITFDDGTTTTYNVTDGEVTEEELERDYAKVDGYYDSMTVGDSEQLISTEFVEDNTPYLLRRSGGDLRDIDNREYNTIVGATVAWNQLQRNEVSRTTNGITFAFSNGALTVSGTATASAWWLASNIGSTWDWYKDHVYIISVGNNDYTFSNDKPNWYIPGGVVTSGDYALRSPTVVVKATASRKQYVQYVVPNGYSFDSPVTYVPQVIDLTLAFGTEIADYVYSLEQASEGSGIAWLKSYGFLTKDYYPYDSGSTVSVKTTEHRMTGKNLCPPDQDRTSHAGINYTIVDNQAIKVSGTATGSSYSWGAGHISYDTCPIKLPAGTYTFSTDNIPAPTQSQGYIMFGGYTESNKALNSIALAGSNTIRTLTFTEPIALYTGIYIAAGQSPNVTIRLQIERGSIATDFEPYEVHSYQLDPDLELRGRFKLDADNRLYAEGDIYPPSGEVERQYGIVDLGTLGYSYITSYAVPSFRTGGISTLVKKVASGSVVANIVCQKYTPKSINSLLTSGDLNIAVDDSGLLFISDSAYTDATTFKTAMSGTYLIYELATPTTEQARPYAFSQHVDGNGTEEYIDNRTVPIPVGHTTQYPPNLRDKLQHLPHLATEDGDYIIKQNDGHMALKPMDSHTILRAQYANQVWSDKTSDDTEPYLLRRSGGSLSIEESETDTLIGGTVAWNQLAKVQSRTHSSGVSIIEDTNGGAILNGTASSTDNLASLVPSVSLKAGRKYLCFGGTENNPIRVGIISKYAPVIFTVYSDSITSIQTAIISGTTYNNVHIPVGLVDLTALFGSAEIADYVYSLEQTTAGAGVAWLKSHGFIDGSYRAYDSGSLQSVKTSEHRTTGKNLLRLQESEMVSTGWASAFPYKTTSGVFNISCQNQFGADSSHFGSTVELRDADDNVIKTLTDYNFGNSRLSDYPFTLTDAEASKISKIVFRLRASNDSFSVVGNAGLMIEYGSTATEYEPYKVHSYPLDSDLELRGLFKLDANNNLYADGDIYPPSGEVSRNYTIVDLGTLNWSVDTSYTYPRFSAENNQLPNKWKPTDTYVRADGLVCAKYVADRLAVGGGVDKTISGYQGSTSIYIADSAYTDAQTFKTAMSGVYLVYKKETPTTETAQPYASPQVVNPLGTEEYIDTRDVPVPVGHYTKYQPNLREKLEVAPDSPNGNGDYILRQTNGSNAYVPFTKELPALPSNDGTYRLGCVISGGTPTLRWELEE